MHETGLVRDLIRKVEALVRENGAARAKQVQVSIGALAHFSPEHFREHFVEESIGSLCEGAQLCIRESQDMSDPSAQDILLDSLEVEMAEVKQVN